MTHGHIFASLDPLKMDEIYDKTVAAKYQTTKYKVRDLLNIEYWGFTKSDLDKTFPIDADLIGGVLATKNEWTLREIQEAMNKAYCGSMGVEYMHISDRAQTHWIRDRMELL
jgi:2-oxoglutarate dehydrogenase E1 component